MLSFKKRQGVAASITAQFKLEGDDVVFRIPRGKYALVETAQPSSTGKSEGLMLKMDFAYEVPLADGGKGKVYGRAGRGGTGVWLAISGDPIEDTPEAKEPEAK